MTTGPCLCGDTYCPRCGDPTEATIDEAMDRLIDNIRDINCDATEVMIFSQAGREAVEHYRKSGGETSI